MTGDGVVIGLGVTASVESGTVGFTVLPPGDGTGVTPGLVVVPDPVGVIVAPGMIIVGGTVVGAGLGDPGVTVGKEENGGDVV